MENKPSFEIRVSEWSVDAAGMRIDDCTELGLIVFALIHIDLDVAAHWVGADKRKLYWLDSDSVKRYTNHT